MAGRGPRAAAQASSVALLLWAGASGCCVAPPRAADLLAVGFRTPEQTLATFQTAVRADEPELQRRCFSAGFQARNRVSSLAWREFWADLVAREPFLRLWLVDARAVGPAEIRDGRARIEALSHGRVLRLELVLDDYCEAWTSGTRAVDEGAPFGERTGVHSSAGGRRWMYGQLELPAGVDPGTVTELRFGREWKIDAFEAVDGASARTEMRDLEERDDTL